MTEQPACPMVAIPAARTMAKPRQSGQTMMIDRGLPLGHLDDLLDMSGTFVDLAKIAVGSVRVYGEGKLRKKLEIYKDHAVRCFIGGGIIERLYALDGRDALAPFFGEARRVGIDVVEISDNYVTLDRDERFRQIGLAREAGLAVFGEIGSKHGHTDVDFLLAQAQSDLLGGQIPSMFVVLSAAIPQINAGKLRALGVTSSRRMPQLPQVPTIDEAGVRGYEVASWIGLAAPAGTPDDVVNRIHDAVAKMATQQDFLQRIQDRGLELALMNPREFADFMAKDQAKWAGVVKQSGARLD